MDSKGQYYTEETLRREVIEPAMSRAERRKRDAEQRTERKHRLSRAMREED